MLCAALPNLCTAFMHQLLVVETLILFVVTMITLIDCQQQMLGAFAAAYPVDIAADS